MKVEKIDHVAIRVKNLEKARKFFEDVFETKFYELGDIPDLDIRSIVDRHGIELVSPLLPDGPTSRVLKKYGEGMTLLSFKVQNLDEAIKDMEARGVRMTLRMRNGDLEMATFHPEDTFGVFIELIEYKTEEPPLRTTIKKNVGRPLNAE